MTEKIVSTFSLFLILISITASAEDLESESVDLGGYKAHFYSKGEGRQTVVMFHGAGNIALVWASVMESLPNNIKLIALDEAGAGKSEFGQLDNTLRQKAFDAMRTLKSANIEGPYIIVGQSLGGLTALEFARQFQNEVEGVILVDSSHPNMILNSRQPDGSFAPTIMRTLASDTLLPEISSEKINPNRDVTPYSMNRDVTKHLEFVPKKYHEAYSAGYQGEIRTPKGYNEHFSNELDFIGNHWNDYNLGDIPLTIITATNKNYEGNSKFSREFLINHQNEKIKSFESLSTSSTLVIAYGVGHAVHMEAPYIVMKAILGLIKN